MKVEYRYNTNNACLMRGTESDEPSETIAFVAASEKEAVLKILKNVWDDYDIENFEDTFEDEINPYTFLNLTQWASELDVGGGSAVLFWVKVGSKTYEANDESDFDFDNEDLYDDYFDDDENEDEL